jgi:excisionase family DNA binding protein
MRQPKPALIRRAFSFEEKMSLEHDPIKKRAVSIREASQMCSLSRATLYRLIASGQLTTIKVASRRLVPVASIDALLSGGEK